VVVPPPVSAPTTAFCRGPPHGVSRSDSKAGTNLKERQEIHQFSLGFRLEFTAASSGLTVLARGANTLSAVGLLLVLAASGATRRIRPAKLANRSLDDEPVPGTRMIIVGYGTTAPAPGGPADTSLFDGIRRWGTSTVDQVIDQNWVTFNRDPVGVCYGDSGAPTFFDGRVVAVASDGALDCMSADNRARVDSREVRNWIKSQIDQRFPF
jgi:Trypsin